MFQKLILALLLCLPLNATVTVDSDITGVGSGLPACSNDGYVVTYDVPTAAYTCESASAGTMDYSVAVDNSLIPDTDDTYDLGDATHEFRNAYIDGILEADSITSGGVAVPTISSTSTLTNKTISSASNTITIDADSATVSNIDNGEIKAAAAIAVNKLAAVTASRALVSDGSGFMSAATTTATQIGYLSAATGTTGTTSTNVVFSASPTFTGTVGTAAISATGNITTTNASTDNVLAITGNTGAIVKVTTSGEYKFAAGRWAGANRYSIIPSTAVDGDTFSNPVIDITASSGALQLGNATLNGAVTIPVTTEASAVGTAAVVASGGVSAAKNIASGGQIWSALDTESGSGTTHTIDFNDGNTTVLDLGDFTGGGAVTLTLSNGKSGGYYCIKIIQETTGGARTITWPSSAPDVKWPGGSTCTLSTGDENVDLVCGVFDGTDYYFSCRNTYS